MNGTEVVATTGDPAFAVDLKGRILAWNEAAERCFGHRRPEVVGRSCWRVLRGRDTSGNRCCVLNCPIQTMARRGEAIHRTKVLFRNALGERALVSMSTLVVPGTHDKEIVHLLGPPPSSEKKPQSLVPGASIKSNARLSDRQLEVLNNLGDGKGTLAIAELLCISPTTVRNHIQHILTRLKVHSRLEAVSLARRIGLI